MYMHSNYKYNKKVGNWPTLADRNAVHLLDHLTFNQWLMINFWWLWYSVKVLHIRHNLYAGTETLSLLLQANRHMHFVWTIPLFWGGGGFDLGGRVWYHLKVL